MLLPLLGTETRKSLEALELAQLRKKHQTHLCLSLPSSCVTFEYRVGTIY